MSVVDTIHNEVRNVALVLVNEVLEEVENLQNARRETPEDRKDGIDEEISMELDRLRFDNVKLNISAMPDQGLAAVVGALVKELWKEEVNSLLDQYDGQDPDYPTNFRL